MIIYWIFVFKMFDLTSIIQLNELIIPELTTL